MLVSAVMRTVTEGGVAVAELSVVAEAEVDAVVGGTEEVEGID